MMNFKSALLTTLILTAQLTYAYKETSSSPLKRDDQNKCSGPDCEYFDLTNALKMAAGRHYPSIQEMCGLGDPTMPEIDVYKKVEALCQNSYFETEGVAARNLIANDARFIPYSEIGNKFDQKLSTLLKDQRFYPDTLFLYFADSKAIAKPKDECGYTGRAECLKAYAVGVQNDARILYSIVSDYTKLAEPRLENCQQKIMNNQSAQWINWFKTTPETAKAFCEVISYPGYLKGLLDKIHADHMPKIKQAMASITKGYTEWQPGVFDNDLSATEFHRASIENLSQFGANCYSEVGIGRISTSPLFESLMDIPGGFENMWFPYAHEFAHLATLEIDGPFVVVKPEIWNSSAGPTKTVAQCADHFFKLKQNAYEENDIAKAETLADMFALEAMAHALPDTAKPADWQKFMYHATTFFCTVMALEGQKTVSEEFFKEDHFRGEHPAMWNRLNYMFSNNRIREKLGCKKIENTATECHDSKINLQSGSRSASSD
jgi:hypothetical protein